MHLFLATLVVVSSAVVLAAGVGVCVWLVWRYYRAAGLKWQLAVSAAAGVAAVAGLGVVLGLGIRWLLRLKSSRRRRRFELAQSRLRDSRSPAVLGRLYKESQEGTKLGLAMQIAALQKACKRGSSQDCSRADEKCQRLAVNHYNYNARDWQENMEQSPDIGRSICQGMAEQALTNAGVPQ